MEKIDDIDTTQPKRPKFISRKTWRDIWKEPASHFPEECPGYIQEGQWSLIRNMAPGPKRDEILCELEAEVAESRAIEQRAEIRQAIQDGAKPFNIFSYYNEDVYGEAPLEEHLGPNWRNYLSPAPPQNVYKD